MWPQQDSNPDPRLPAFALGCCLTPHWEEPRTSSAVPRNACIGLSLGFGSGWIPEAAHILNLRSGRNSRTCAFTKYLVVVMFANAWVTGRVWDQTETKEADEGLGQER